ncbi:MAG TPA: hypothetical protein VE133_00895, partial [Candidatus Sulfotelmatobacter sp.]|nr:hypothetical protein [Candidatus Sulfotelmatobacter sp.]
GVDGAFAMPKSCARPAIQLWDAKALDRVTIWKFRPCTKDGKVVNCLLTLEWNFICMTIQNNR